MYNLTDLHLHSRFSWDAEQTIEDVVKKAQKQGIKYCAMTEHIDLMDEHQRNYLKFDYEGYTGSCERNREIFPGLIKGIETGEVHKYSGRFEAFLEGREFDYVIGAMHMFGETTPVFDKFFKQYKTLEDAYKAYFEEEFKLISRGGFDVAAHMTLVHRQGAKFFKKPVYESFKKEIDDILSLMVGKKIGLEVNTSGLNRFPAKDFIPDRETIKAYIRLGGDIITVGSDSHKINDTFTGIEEAYKMLEGLGVKEVTVFKKRKPVKVKIKQG
jgi:histidinol-phosphatase (PHP family)